MANPETCYEDGKFLVQTTNNMLSQLHVEQRVVHWSNINAQVFVLLFEGISGGPLRDVIRPTRCREDEIHNVQVVIDTLSMDILHVSLSHITGEGVVAGSKKAIGNLMEVMMGLLEFILEGIGSDVFSATSGSDIIDLVEDPDIITGDLIDEILEKELSKKCTISDISHTDVTETPLASMGSVDNISHTSANNTSELIALGDSRYASQSPTHRGPSATLPFTAPSRKDPTSNVGYTSKYKSATVPLPSSHERGHKEAWSAVGTSPPSRLKDPVIHSTSRASHSLAHRTAASSSKPVRLQNNSSVSSSVDRPQHPAESGVPPNFEFEYRGKRSRSEEIQGPAGSGVVTGVASTLGGLGMPSSSSFTHHLYHHFEKPVDRAGVNLPDFSSSLPLDNSVTQSYSATWDHTMPKDGPSTMPVHSAQTDDRRYNSTFPVPANKNVLNGRAHSYDNLHNLMHDTVAMSRAAVRTSPLRKRLGAKDPTSPTHASSSMSSLNRTEPKEISNKGSRSRQATTHKEGGIREKPELQAASWPPKAKSASAPVSPKGIRLHPRKGDSADKSNKKVSFKVGRSTDQSSKKSDKNGGTRPAQRSLMKNAPDTVGFASRSRQTNTFPKNSTYPGPADYTAHKHAAPRSLFSTARLSSDYKPQTFAEYLDKYHGILDQRDRLVSTVGKATDMPGPNDSTFELSDASPCRADEYSGDADVSEDVEAEIIRHVARLPKSVRFNRIEDDSTHGRMGSIRHKLRTESKKNMVKAQALERLYDLELEDFEEDVADHMKSTRVKSHNTDREYKKKVLRAPKTNKIKPKKTSVLRPRVRTRSNLAQPRGRKLVAMRGRKRSSSASPAVGRRHMKSPVRVCDDDLLPWLLEEFPFLHLSKETLHELWRKSSRQVQQLTKAQLEVRRKKSKAQVQIEEAQRRHGILKDIMKKEMAHNERMKELKDRQNHQQSVRMQLRNRRAQSARARRYYDDFQVRLRSKMLKKRTREELVFKRLFKDGLDIQRDRIQDMRRYAREERERRSQCEQNQLESIENYYRDQFALVSEAISRERKDIETKDKAQSKVVEQMKRELRQKMEREIRTFQEQLYRDEDEEYFRELDANRMRQHLQLCRYQASI